MDPAVIVFCSLFGVIGVVMMLVGMSPEAGPLGSFGGLILLGACMVLSGNYNSAHYTSNDVLIQNGIACYVGSPTNATTTFMLIDKNGQQIKP